MPSSKDEISSLKHQIAEAKILLAKRTEVNQKREQLEDYLRKIQDEISTEIFDLYQRDTGNASERAVREQTLEAKEALAAEIKTKKQQFDHLLDQWEDISDEHIADLQNRLILLLLKEHPEQEPFYAHYLQQSQSLQVLAWDLKTLSSQCRQIAEALDSVFLIRKEIRQQGLLRYVFGRNPTFLITAHLKHAAIVAKEALQFLPQSHLEKSFQLHAEHPLQELLHHCERRWGFRTLDTLFVHARESIGKLETECQHEHESVVQQKADLEKELEDWMREIDKGF